MPTIPQTQMLTKIREHKLTDAQIDEIAEQVLNELVHRIGKVMPIDAPDMNDEVSEAYWSKIDSLGEIIGRRVQEMTEIG